MKCRGTDLAVLSVTNRVFFSGAEKLLDDARKLNLSTRVFFYLCLEREKFRAGKI